LYGKSEYSEWICKFKDYNDKNDRFITDEYYQIHFNNSLSEGKSVNWGSLKKARLATDEEIQRILTKVAKIKYPIGTIIINTYGEKVKLKQDNTIYSFHDHNQIYASSLDGLIYNDGIWAEIVE